MTIRGAFDDACLPYLELEAGPEASAYKRVSFLVDTGFSDHLAISQETYARFFPDRSLEAIDPLEFVRTCNTATGSTDFKVCYIFVKPDAVPAFVPAVVCGMDAVGASFLAGARVILAFAPNEEFELVWP